MISSASSAISKSTKAEQGSLLESAKEKSSVEGDELLEFLNLLNQSVPIENTSDLTAPLNQKNILLENDKSLKSKIDPTLLKLNADNSGPAIVSDREMPAKNVLKLDDLKLETSKLENPKLKSTPLENQSVASLTKSGEHQQLKNNVTLDARTNVMKMQETPNVSSEDLMRMKQLIENKGAIKQYQKLQVPKIIKNEIATKNEVYNLSDKLQSEFNFIDLSSNLSFDNSNKSLQSHSDSTTISNKNNIDSLANQIAQRIQEVNTYKPIVQNSNIQIEVNHEELGHLTLNIKKNQRDLEIKIMTGHSDAKTIIHENREALIGQLAMKGITVNSLSVESLSSGIATSIAEDAKGSQTGKFDSQTQQNSSQQQDQSRHSGQNLTGREKRDELWNILKDKREVMYA